MSYFSRKRPVRRRPTTVTIAPPRKPERIVAKVEAHEISGVTFTPDGSRLDLMFRDEDGALRALTISREILGAAFARLADQVELTVSTTTDDGAAKVQHPPNAWRLEPVDLGVQPALSCRSGDGLGFDLRFHHDPITARPRLDLTVDL